MYIDENGESAANPGDKSSRKFKKWKKRNRKNNIGKSSLEMYQDFAYSKNFLGVERHELKWFKESETQSNMTNWNVETNSKTTKMSIELNSDNFVGKGSLNIMTDIGINQGTIEIKYNMLNVADKLEIRDAETNEIIFTTADSESADVNGKVIYKEGSGETVKFKLEDNKTKIIIIINDGKGDPDSTKFELILKVKLNDDKKASSSEITNTGK
jgi:hypothetical protein